MTVQVHSAVSVWKRLEPGFVSYDVAFITFLLVNRVNLF